MPVIDIIIRLVQKGNVITGKHYGEKDDVPVADGKVENGKIRLVIDTVGYWGKFQWVFEGTLEDGQLVMSRRREDAVTRTEDQPERQPQKIASRKMA